MRYACGDGRSGIQPEQCGISSKIIIGSPYVRQATVHGRGYSPGTEQKMIQRGVLLPVVTVATVIASNQAPIDLGGIMLSRTVTHSPHDGAFRFCRLRFHSSSEGDGDGWWVDYPRADVNLSIRLAELTRSHVSFDASNDPVHQVEALTDPELFRLRDDERTREGVSLP
jgi:hypothetical protein